MKDRLELELRDSTPVIVRPLLEEDRAMVAEAYRRLSPEARYQRFWTRTGEMLGDAMLDRLVKQNPVQHMTWAVLDPARKFPGVGGASWWRNAASPDEAEISAMVLDADQRRGIGHPAGPVLGELDTAGGRRVPQEAVAAAAERERNVHLGVVLQHRQHAALLVEQPVLALAEAPEMLVVVGAEGRLDLPGFG